MKRVKDSKIIEKLAEEIGYTNLDWLCPEGFFKKDKNGNYQKENGRFVLFGKPANYLGPYADYNEPIFAEIRNKKYMKKIGYRKVIKEGTFGIYVGKFVMN